MTRTDKIEEIHQLLLSSDKVLTIECLEETLKCSRSTVYRLFENLKKVKGRKVVLDSKSKGYKYHTMSANIIGSLSHPELTNLLLIKNKLKDFDPNRMQQIFGDHDIIFMIDSIILRRYPSDEERIPLVKVVPDIVRSVEDTLLSQLLEAINEKKYLDIRYRSHGKDEVTDRTISPQQVVYYRHNWYLDSWCFKRTDWRIFALDGIQNCVFSQTEIPTHAQAAKDKSIDTNHGIFRGHPNKTATLIFSKKIAHWISKEQWHPKQIGRQNDNGTYELKIPFAYEVELITDILKWGDDVFVQSPRTLRDIIISNMQKNLEQYKTFL